MKVAHLTTIDSSLRYLVYGEMLAVAKAGGESLGISAPGPWVEELEAVGIRHIPLHSSTRGMDVLATCEPPGRWRQSSAESGSTFCTPTIRSRASTARVSGRLAGADRRQYCSRAVCNRRRPLAKACIGLRASRCLPPGSPMPSWSKTQRTSSRRPDGVSPRAANVPTWQRSPPRKIDPTASVQLIKADPADFGNRRRPDSGRHGGCLVAEKGYPELFEAAERLDERFRLICIGPPILIRQIGFPRGFSTGSSGRRPVSRMRQDIEALYAAMEGFCCPRTEKAFPARDGGRGHGPAHCGHRHPGGRQAVNDAVGQPVSYLCVTPPQSSKRCDT